MVTVVGIQSLGSTTVTVNDGQMVVQGPDQAAATQVAQMLASGAAKIANLNGKQVLLLTKEPAAAAGEVVSTPVPGPVNHSPAPDPGTSPPPAHTSTAGEETSSAKKIKMEKEHFVSGDEYDHLRQENDQLKQEKEALEQKQQVLCLELEDRVTCPVCLEVPTAGPLYTCPRGHLVCSSCFQGPAADCPTCRAKMGTNLSLIGATVIEHIEHACRFVGCQERTPLASVEQHKGTCSYRLVACPAVRCKERVALCRVMEHVLHTCGFSYAKNFKAVRDVNESNAIIIDYLGSTERITGKIYKVDTLQWRGRFFFLTLKPRQDGRSNNIYVQMLGTGEECNRYKVAIGLKDQGGNCNIDFCDHPSPIEMTEAEKDSAGLLVVDKMLEKCFSPQSGSQGKSILEINLEFKEVM